MCENKQVVFSYTTIKSDFSEQIGFYNEKIRGKILLSKTIYSWAFKIIVLFKPFFNCKRTSKMILFVVFSKHDQVVE